MRVVYQYMKKLEFNRLNEVVCRLVNLSTEPVDKAV